MKEEALEKIGLSKNEAKVYVALLRLGTSTATEITKQSGVHRTNVYDALENLIKKGCVAYILRGDTKYFEATNPENLKSILMEKKLHLSSILPQLMLKNKEIKQDVIAHVYEGYTELKKMINSFVENRTEYYSFGLPMQFPKALGSWLEWHHKDRVAKKVPLKLIFNEEAKDRAKIVNQKPLAEARYLPRKFNQPVTTEVSNGEIMIILWNEKPIIIHIKCKEIANAYKRYFNLLWTVAKKP